MILYSGCIKQGTTAICALWILVDIMVQNNEACSFQENNAKHYVQINMFNYVRWHSSWVGHNLHSLHSSILQCLMRRGLPKEMSLDSPISLSMLFHARASKANRFLKWATRTSCRHWNFQLFFRFGPLGLHCFVLSRDAIRSMRFDTVTSVGQMSWRCWRLLTKSVCANDFPCIFGRNKSLICLAPLLGLAPCKHMFGSWFFCVVLSRCGNPVWECWAHKMPLRACEPRSSRQHWMWWTWRLQGLNWKGAKKWWRGTCNFKSFSIMCYSWTPCL